ncbi:MAG: DinB family protein [Chitinophagaceae bacterium]|nr:MAG: DinB family protein [Chitinophagaceae bacterium]
MQIPSSIATRLQYQHKSLLDILDGLSDEQIRRNIQAGKWSIFENIVHLQTYQHTFIARVKRILDEESPAFPAYTAEADPVFHDNVAKSSREIMQDLLSVRKELCNGILSFKESDFIKNGLHPKFGKMNLMQWLNFFLLHEAHHLFTIFKLASEIKQETNH